MKPAYRTTVYPLPPAANPHSGVENDAAPNALRWISTRLSAWWRDHQRQRYDRQRLEALASLDKHLLHDIGLSDELRAHALAQHESHHERFARSVSEAGGFGGRFGF